MYGVRTEVPARGKRPCAFGTHGTQEADTRSPYVQYGGSGACVSTWAGHRAPCWYKLIEASGEVGVRVGRDEGAPVRREA